MFFIITSCTNSKKIVSNASLTISSYSKSLTLKTAIEMWNNSIKNNYLFKFPADTIYKGQSWQYSLKTYKHFSNYSISKLLIVSAGYGLIYSDEKICSYNCTFTKNTLNSISKFQNVSNINSNIIWWDVINKFSINDFPDDSNIFLVLPYEYLIATQNYINQLINRFSTRVFIFTANINPIPNFMTPYVVKFDARFDTFQKGVKSSLLQRATYWLSNEITNHSLELKHAVLQNHIEKHLQNYEKFNMPIGIKLSEDELNYQISLMINKLNITSATSGLRLLRKNGMSCEQKRFGLLFKKIKSGMK